MGLYPRPGRASYLNVPLLLARAGRPCQCMASTVFCIDDILELIATYRAFTITSSHPFETLGL